MLADTQNNSRSSRAPLNFGELSSTRDHLANHFPGTHHDVRLSIFNKLNFDGDEYPSDEERDVFDDNISGNESSYSVASTKCEDLHKQDIIAIANRLPRSEVGTQLLDTVMQYNIYLVKIRLVTYQFKIMLMPRVNHKYQRGAPS
jgi:hypothetical protein